MAQITKRMIDMYIDMVKDEFKPVIESLTDRTTTIRNEIEDQVKKELGYYELEAQLAALCLKITEVSEKLHQLKGTLRFGIGKDTVVPFWDNDQPSLIRTETEKRLKQINQPLVDATNTMNAAIRKVKLMSCGKDFANIMQDITIQVALLASNVKQLPPIEEDLKQIAA